MSISTKTGDDGTTALMFGRRVSKTDPRVEAYGAVDELNAALGLARATCPVSFVAEQILAVQKELVVLMGELALSDEDRNRYGEKGFEFTSPQMVDRLTALVDDMEKNRNLRMSDWAIPGGSPGGAALDMARTICRRAERRVIGLGRPDLHAEVIRYLNRLSDLCWLYGRFVETTV